MEDFRLSSINSGRNRNPKYCAPIMGFAIEDYLAVCDEANIIITDNAKIFGFCLTEEHLNDVFSESLSNLLNSIDKQNISVIVIDFCYFLENTDDIVSIDEFDQYVDAIMAENGFQTMPPFDTTYEQRFVYIGDTEDGKQVKQWIKEKYLNKSK